MRRFTTAAILCPVALTLAVTVAPLTAQAAFTRVLTLGVGDYPNYSFVRTTDGALHLMYQTTAAGSSAPDGLATRAISASGKLSAPVQALSGWGTPIPGLTVLPGGSLLAAFGAIEPVPPNTSSMWTISSTDGGATWSAPTDSSSGILEQLAYNAVVSAQTYAGAPLLALSVAGSLVTQQGLGANAPTRSVVDSSDDFAGDVNSAVDASTGAVILSWDSLASSGGDFIREVAPTLGPVVHAPGKQHDELQLAGRDTGPGVFAAYSNDGQHVRLLNYNGGTVSVGSYKGVSASALGVTTGPDGRIWVMWGADSGGIAITRSNKAVTKFERIQHVDPKALTLYRVSGDGRPGPLDLLVDEVPSAAGNIPGTFYERVNAVMTVNASVATHKSKTGKALGYTVKFKVADAGDPLPGATIKLGAKTGKTNSQGALMLKLPASTAVHEALSVTKDTYRKVAHKLKL